MGDRYSGALLMRNTNVFTILGQYGRVYLSFMSTIPIQGNAILAEGVNLYSFIYLFIECIFNICLVSAEVTDSWTPLKEVINQVT